jgi:outer membrane protein OmpA-like peptidoglycan-associated protein
MAIIAVSASVRERVVAEQGRPLNRALRWRSRVLLAGAAACAVGGVSREASAQNLLANNGAGMDSHLFRPALDSKGLFVTNGTDILGRNAFSFGLVLDYGNTLLRVNDVGQGSPELIKHSFQGTFQFNYGIANLLTVGLDIPVGLLANDAQAEPNGSAVLPGQWGTNQLDSQTVGFLAAHAKWRILRVENGFGLALALQGGGSPSSAPQNAGADPGVWFWPQIIAERRFGQDRVKIDLNAGVRAHTGSGTVLNLKDGVYKDGDLVTFGGGVAVRVLEPLDLVAETYGSYLVNPDSSSAIRLSAEAVGGVKVFVEHNSYLMMGGGAGYTKGFEAADGRAFLGFIWEPSIGDRDGDGIPDDVDKCPDEGGPDVIRDPSNPYYGCPDRDHDGIADIVDACPNISGQRGSDPRRSGCPDAADGDRDGDGILDSHDACPDVPGVHTNDPKTNGCPKPPESDRDHDGIPDALDKCPDEGGPDVIRDPKNSHYGCPDRDHDGIADVVDKCPNEPAPANGVNYEDGCPDKGSVVIEENNIVVLEKIKFKTGSAEILPESNAILDAVASALSHHPEFLLLEVAGHADERGDDIMNLKLTQARVNSVVAALVQRGTAADRLRSKGYGEYCPEDPGHTPEAWEKNRRVEFKIVKTKDGPTGVELGCANAVAHGVKPAPVP